MYRPAGMSDDESDEDDILDIGRRPRPNLQPTNGAPKTVEEAIFRNDIEACKKILDMSITRGVSIDACLPSSRPALILACDRGFLEGVQMMLEKGANPNVEKEFITPLSSCCSIGVILDETRAACVELLLASGADPNVIDSHGQVPLMRAASQGFKLVVAKLLESPKTSLTITDPRGWTALFFALEFEHTEIAEMLIAAGLDPETKERDGYRAHDLFYAEPPAAQVKVAELFLDSCALNVDLKVEKEVEPSVRCLNDFFEQLPNSDGDGGFSGAVGEILSSAGCGNLNLSNPDLYTVLSGSDEELQRLGVKLAPLRRRILRAVHRYHLHPWSQMSLHHIKEKQPGLDQIINVIATVLRHLVIIRAALTYLRGRISRSNYMAQSATHEQLKLLVELHEMQAQLQQRLRPALSKIEKIKDIGTTRPGYIGPVKEGTARLLRVSGVTVLATILLAAFTYFRSQ